MKKILSILIISSIFVSGCFRKDKGEINIPGKFISWAKESSAYEFSDNNIIYSLLFMEMDVSGKGLVEDTYKLLGAIIKRVKEKGYNSLRPQAKLKLVYDILNRDFGIKYLEKRAQLLSQSIPNKYYDCDTGSMVFLAIAQELNWPLNIIRIPDHMFIRWNDNTTQFNFEVTTGDIIEDSLYICFHNIHPDSIEKGIFFKELSRTELIGCFYVLRGNSKNALEDIRGGIADFSKAIKLSAFGADFA